MKWIKKNWIVLTIVAVIIAVVGGILFYKFVWSGNAESQADRTEVTAGVPLDKLSGHYVSSKKKGKAEIYFFADATKEAEGVFKKFKATLDIEASISSAKIKVVVQSGSVYTNNDVRDDHLNSEDFFYTEEYPEIIFTSDRIEMINTKGDFKAIGKLLFLGKEWDFEFPFKFRGVGFEDGNEMASFEGKFNFDHKAHGMKKSGDAEKAEITFYVDMIKGNPDDDEEEEDDWEEDGWEDEEEAESLPVRKYDDQLDKVEEEAK